MKSLGIVARAVLMEAENNEESRTRKYGKRAAYGAAAAGGAYLGGMGSLGAYRGYKAARSMKQGAMDTVKTMGRGASASIRRPVAALRPAVSRGVGGIKAAMQSGYARAMNFGGSPTIASGGTPRMPIAGQTGKAGYLQRGANFVGKHKVAAGIGAGIGAAGLGYGAYKAYQKRAKAAAREAYYNTYMSLMEAAEQEQQAQPSFAKRWGKRALVGAGIAAGGAVGASALRGGLMQRGKGAKAIASGAYGGARKMLLHPLKQGQAMTAHGKRVLRDYRGKQQQKLPGM